MMATTKHEFLTPKDMKQLSKLCQKDNWIIEKLGIKSKFLYKELSPAEKRTALLTSIPQLINDPTFQGMAVGYRNLLGYFCCFPAIFSAIFPWIKMKQMIIPMATTIVKTSSIPLLFLIPYATYQIRNLYNDAFNTLLEQNKEYIWRLPVQSPRITVRIIIGIG